MGLHFDGWQFRTTGADGLRHYDFKGTWAPFVAQLVLYKITCDGPLELTGSRP
jgi:hypothetical protein